MKASNFLTLLVRSARLTVVMFACAIVFFAQMPLAAAMENTSSKPTDGPVKLEKILDKTEDALRSPPGLQKVERESSKGLNEVQGSADAEKMKRSTGSSATKLPVEEELEEALKSVSKKK